MFSQFNKSFVNLMDKLQGWIDAIVLSLPNLILALIVLLLSVFAARLLKKMALKGIGKISGNRTVTVVLGNLVVAVFMLVSLFIILSILNLDDAVTALLGTAGVVGLAVGLALQDPMVNLFSGVIMSVRPYYRIGDLIETNGFFGSIQKINLRSTIILKPDGQEVIIPNKEILQNPLVNYSHNGRRRIDIPCGVSYGDDLEKAKSVAVEAIENSGLDIEESKPIEMFFTGFGDSSIDFTIRFWKNITGQADYLAARDKAIIAIKKSFDQHGITIPFPIRTMDFGVQGGLPIHEIYPPKNLEVLSANGSEKKN